MSGIATTTSNVQSAEEKAQAEMQIYWFISLSYGTEWIGLLLLGCSPISAYYRLSGFNPC